MNKLILLLIALLFSLAVAEAQEASGLKSNLEVQKGGKGGEKMALSPPKGASKPEGTQITYGGYLADVANANKSVKVIDPRNPARSTKSVPDNVYTDPQGKIRGFVLFAIKF